MKTFIKNVIMQTIRALFGNKSYPYGGIPLQYWSCYVTLSFKTKYDHWKTLKNYICNKSVAF